MPCEAHIDSPFTITWEMSIRAEPNPDRLGVDQEIRPAIGFGLLLFADLTRQFIWLSA